MGLFAQIRVVLAGELSVGALDVTLISGSLQSEGGVVVWVVHGGWWEGLVAKLRVHG